MLSLRRLALAALVALAPLAAAAPAAASPSARVEWTRVEGPKGNDEARLAKALKPLLQKAAKKASFGKAKAVSVSARVVEYTVVEHGDVLRITCAIHGQVAGGAGAKSRLSFGGSPANRQELEKQVLTMVANGLVTRLAQIARAAPVTEPAPSAAGGARARRGAPGALRR